MWLIDRGSSLETRDKQGKLPIEIAREVGFMDLCRLIEGMRVYLQNRQVVKLKGYSYVSVFIDSFEASANVKATQSYRDFVQPRVRVSLLNDKKQLLEEAIEIAPPAIVSPSNITWLSTWNMKTPLENLEGSTVAVFEFFQQPGILTSRAKLRIDRETIDSTEVYQVSMTEVSATTDGDKLPPAAVVASMKLSITISRKLKSYLMSDLRSNLS